MWGERGPKPWVMGILNITPDSFSDGGQYTTPQAAYDHAHDMIDAGVDVIDIGGEASNPGAKPVSLQEELDRVLPVIERLRANSPVCLSIDTYKPEVMQAAVACGASMINDIYALGRPGALEVAAQLDVPICLMHMQGTPQTMQNNPIYTDVLQDIQSFFHTQIQACLDAGINKARLWLDPGIGFGKTLHHNIAILKHLRLFQSHGLPLILGVSRKRLFHELFGQSVSKRLAPGLAVALWAAQQGVAMIRTHDVEETKQALHMLHLMSPELG